MLDLIPPQPMSAPSPFDRSALAVIDDGGGGVRLQILTPGDLESVAAVELRRVAPGPGQIEVGVSASSVNFSDLLVATDQYPRVGGRRPQLGADFAGVVTAVGPDVTDHHIGDRVGGTLAGGCWSTFVRCDAHLAVTLPPNLGDAHAAAVTTASATAWYSLHQLARIQPGERVLIHSATGGVGQAAMAVARAAGAEIFATAGTRQRRELLRDMGVEHVYDSRGTEFAELIRRDTDGYGLDIVLNSRTGAARRAGLDLLSFGGRFIELGVDQMDADSLGLVPFRRNLALYGVDLRLMSASRPEEVCELLDTVYWLSANGVLPLPDVTHYPFTEAAAALRAISAAEHTGEVVLDFPGP